MINVHRWSESTSTLQRRLWRAATSPRITVLDAHVLLERVWRAHDFATDSAAGQSAVHLHVLVHRLSVPVHLATERARWEMELASAQPACNNTRQGLQSFFVVEAGRARHGTVFNRTKEVNCRTKQANSSPSHGAQNECTIAQRSKWTQNAQNKRTALKINELRSKWTNSVQNECTTLKWTYNAQMNVQRSNERTTLKTNAQRFGFLSRGRPALSWTVEFMPMWHS